MVRVFIDYYSRKYYAPILSCGFLTFIIFVFATIFLPYIFCYISGNFFFKTQSYFEQPIISFNNEFLILIKTDATLGEYVFTSLSDLQSSFGTKIKGGQIQSFYYDNNNDNIPEKIRIQIKFPISQVSTIVSITSIFEFSYQLQKNAIMGAKTLAILKADSDIGIANLIASGQLRLNQRNSYLLNSQSFNSSNSSILSNLYNFNIFEVLNNYFSRNDTTQFISQSFIQPYGHPSELSIDVSILVPINEEIIYRPNSFESLKLAWYQYFSLLYPIYLILFSFLGFLFRFQVIPTELVEGNKTHQKIKKE